MRCVFACISHKPALSATLDIKIEPIQGTPKHHSDIEKFFLGRPSYGITLSQSRDSINALPASFSVDLSHSDIQRWKLAARVPAQIRVPGRSLTTRIRNFPQLDFALSQWPLYVGLGLTGFIYGGLHCLAWDAPFSSDLERLLWRLSSMSIASTGGLVVLVFSWNIFRPLWGEAIGMFGGVERSFWRMGIQETTLLMMRLIDRVYDMFPFHLGVFQRIHDRLSVPRFLDLLFLAVCFIPFYILYMGLVLVILFLKVIPDVAVVTAILLYALARVYLVVECFINLSHLPPSAYQLPRWSQYVPHIA